MDDERKEWSMFAAAALQGILSSAEKYEVGLHFTVVNQAIDDSADIADRMVKHAEQRFPAAQ